MSLSGVSRFALRSAGWETDKGRTWTDPVSGEDYTYEQASTIQARRDFANNPERQKAEQLQRMADAIYELVEELRKLIRKGENA